MWIDLLNGQSSPLYLCRFDTVVKDILTSQQRKTHGMKSGYVIFEGF
jgi:hypothetical protein